MEKVQCIGEVRTFLKGKLLEVQRFTTKDGRDRFLSQSHNRAGSKSGVVYTVEVFYRNSILNNLK